MDNEQFKLGMKITITIAIIVIGIIIGALINVFCIKPAKPDIYSEILSNTDKELDMTKVNEIALESKGIDKDEFNNYLSIFGLLVNKYPALDKEENEKTTMIDAAVEFLNTSFMYEPKMNENQVETYEADKVNKIIKEMKGEYINKNLDVSVVYTYDANTNTYVPQEMEPTNCLLLETLDINKKDEKIETTFKVAFPGNGEYATYLEKEPIEIETFTIKAIVLENEEYEYSKYYVSNIEVVKKEKETISEK